MHRVERTTLVEQDEGHVLPQCVKRALGHMRANLAGRITLNDLASACVVSERTLLRQFGRFIGVAPLSYLRRLRLNAAKNELTDTQNNDAISDIATRYCFAHFGRFSRDYRKVFGETPTATRQRARARVTGSVVTKGDASRLGSYPPDSLPSLEREKPSLQILPFDTDTLQESREARDLTERLAATLSRIHVAVVVLAQSSRSMSTVSSQPRYKGTQYCLRGRLTQRDARTRVIVRLVDIDADQHVWGDSFDGSANDPFELQDRVVDGVLTDVVSRITDMEIERANNKDPRDQAVRDLTLQALPLVLNTNVRSAEQAIAVLGSAIELDPADAVATALLGYCHAQLASFHSGTTLAAGRARAQRLTQYAGLLDNDHPLVTIARGTVASFLRQPEEEDALVARALAMDPTSPWAWERRGYIRQGHAFRLHSAELADLAIGDFQRSMRFRGRGMPRASCLYGIASSHYAAGRYQEALRWSRRALTENPGADWIHKLLSCSANKLGEKATVVWSVDCMRRARPHLTVSEIVEFWPWADSGWLETIARAGMPLGSSRSRRSGDTGAAHTAEIPVKG